MYAVIPSHQFPGFKIHVYGVSPVIMKQFMGYDEWRIKRKRIIFSPNNVNEGIHNLFPKIYLQDEIFV